MEHFHGLEDERKQMRKLIASTAVVIIALTTLSGCLPSDAFYPSGSTPTPTETPAKGVKTEHIEDSGYGYYDRYGSGYIETPDGKYVMCITGKNTESGTTPISLSCDWDHRYDKNGVEIVDW